MRSVKRPTRAVELPKTTQGLDIETGSGERTQGSGTHVLR